MTYAGHSTRKQRIDNRSDVKRLFLLLIATLGWFAPAAGQIDWTPYENNPVITPDFDIESQATYRPSVIKWQGKYHMWYGKLWQSTRWIAYTTSDDGISWSNTAGNTPPTFDNAVLGPSATSGAFDELEATHGSVILDGDTLKMWYTGSGSQASGIGLAWSINGVDWKRIPGPAAGNSVLDPGSDGTGSLLILEPTVVKHDGIYHMWYVRLKVVSTTLGYVARLGYARSTDGRSWEVISGSGADGAVLDIGTGSDFDAAAVQWPSALYNNKDERFELWYQGLYESPFGSVVGRVGCARSDDGVTWEKIADSESVVGECFRQVAQPFVLLENGLYKMWYALSASGKNGDVIMHGTSGEASTSIEENELPSQVSMLEIYPNPTAARANVQFSAYRYGAYVLEARDLLGRVVSRVDLGTRSIGEHAVVWGGSDVRGARLPSGAYLLSVANVSTGERVATGIVHIVR